MKLYFAPASPYSRKVRVVAHELGVDLELEQLNATAWDNDYGRVNPVNRVPALRRDDGSALLDSPVICEYLDVTYGSRLLPLTGERRWQVLLQQALGDGIMDAAVPRRHETLRAPEQQSADRIKLYRRSIDQTLDHLETIVDSIDAVTIGSIAIACALSYLDFRFADDRWAATRPKLKKWSESMFIRPSFAATPLG